MSTILEQKLRSAFARLGSFSKLANGFRQQARGQQTTAVYFSGNAPGNLIEIGLSIKALAPLLNKSEREISEWIRQQAAITGRERLSSGQRGSYAGLAFGSERELDAFIQAWSEFQMNPVKPPDANLLDVTRVEKAASDAGFDLTPKQVDEFRVFRSASFQYALGVKPLPLDRYQLVFSDAAWGEKVAADCACQIKLQSGQWPAVIEDIASYAALYQLLQRAGGISRVHGKQALAEFQSTIQRMPASTEAERLVVQRVGQDIFRKSLIEYWQGRCAVTGLGVVPLLRASHIKPWAECANDTERLDVYNGLLLAPHLDALFDGGWISFLDKGEMVMSAQLTEPERALLGLRPGMGIAGLTDGHYEYLCFHRAKHGFNGAGQ